MSVPSPIVFIASEIFGVAGAVFTDFGNEFIVSEKKREKKK